jgi:hypothetical protein
VIAGGTIDREQPARERLIVAVSVRPPHSCARRAALSRRRVTTMGGRHVSSRHLAEDDRRPRAAIVRRRPSRRSACRPRTCWRGGSYFGSGGGRGRRRERPHAGRGGPGARPMTADGAIDATGRWSRRGAFAGVLRDPCGAALGAAIADGAGGDARTRRATGARADGCRIRLVVGAAPARRDPRRDAAAAIAEARARRPRRA